MKKIFLLAALMLLITGAVMAQSSTSSAPGPTLQREPGEANNNLPNPGNPQTNLDRNQGTTGSNPTGATDTTTTGSGLANDQVDQDDDVAGATATDANRRDTTTTGAMDDTDTDTTTAGDYDQSLPDTGSELPLLGLVGLLALGAAAALRLR
jgi:LPXTG-motif cell wall-anchored protein